MNQQPQKEHPPIQPSGTTAPIQPSGTTALIREHGLQALTTVEEGIGRFVEWYLGVYDEA